MSRRTKAELLAEIEALRRELDICEDQRQLFLDELDREGKDGKIFRKALDDVTARHVDHINQTDRKIEKHNTGVNQINAKTKPKRAYIEQRYQFYRDQDILKKRARDLANTDTAEKFGKGYDPRHLERILKT